MSPRSIEPAPPRPIGAARPSWLVSPWLPAIVGAVCFLNSLPNGFVYDDARIVRDNPRIRTLTDWRGIWLTDWWQPHGEYQEIVYRQRDRLYRPLTLFSFALNYAVSGSSPLGFHAVNVVLHAVMCALVWLLVRRFLGDALVATAAALLFAVHPVHSEAVANVVGRAEIMAAIFLALGLLLISPPVQTAAQAAREAGSAVTPSASVGAAFRPWKLRLALASATFLLALLSKETAVCYPALAGLALLARPREARGKTGGWIIGGIILLVPLALYLPARYFALDHHLVRELLPGKLVNPLALEHGPARWLHALTVLGHYVRLTLVPASLSSNYGYAIIDPDRGFDPMMLPGLLAAGAVIWGLSGAFSERRHRRIVAALCAALVASYVLISNTLLVIGVSLAERLWYWPSVIVFALLAWGAMALWRYCTARGERLAALRRLLPIGGIVLLGGLGLRCLARNFDWHDGVSLLTADTMTYPQGAELHQALAHYLLEEALRTNEGGYLVAAKEHVDNALRIAPSYTQARYIQARIAWHLGDAAAAERALNILLQQFPRDQLARQFLAHVRGDDKRFAEQVQQLEAQVATRPADADLLLQLGRARLDKGDYSQALEACKLAAAAAPDNGEALRSLAEAYVVNNRQEEAVEAYRRALQVSPDDWRIHVNLSALLYTRDPAAALQHAEKAYELMPTSIETTQNLAEALAVNGRLKEALVFYRDVQRSMPPQDWRRAAIDARIAELEAGRP